MRIVHAGGALVRLTPEADAGIIRLDHPDPYDAYKAGVRAADEATGTLDAAHWGKVSDILFDAFMASRA